jgi:APA family basic amino acid/polyamine antiporter
VTADVVAPKVFTRRASGLVRVMSPYSAFIYNILTMGVIFPWTYVWAPTAFQGSNLAWGIFIAFLLELPIALSYAWLATALPRSGGDYVFQSRVFGGGIGFTVVFGFFVIWILQWVALSGWLLAVLGLAPTLIGLGVTTGISALTNLGTWAASSTGIIVISIVNAAVSLLLLCSGFRNYVRLQYVMWYGILISFAVMLLVFVTNQPATAQAKLDAFALAVDGVKNFFATAHDAAAKAGVDFNPPPSFFGTLMVAPIAWTSLQWCTYSVEQGGEIKDAHVLRNQLFILGGSLVLTTVLLILLALGLQHAVGDEGIRIASAGYWLGVKEATIGGTFLMPNLIAIALAGSPILILLIGFGYILNSFQIVCNCYIGVTRIMVAQALDGLLPDWFSRIHPRWKTPVNAHLAYFVASLPIIIGYNTVPSWGQYTLGVTFANGAVFVLSALAAALLPYRARAIYQASPGSRYVVAGIPLVTMVGALGALTGAFMVGSFLVVPDLGLAYSNSLLPYVIVAGTALLGLAVYWAMRTIKARQGFKVEYAFMEIPPE